MKSISISNRRWAPAIAALVAVAAGAVVAPAAGAATGSPIDAVYDGFGRTLSAGWGTAIPTGDVYTTMNDGTAGTAGMSTNGTAAVMTVPAASHYRQASQKSVIVQDSDATVDINLAKLPAGGAIRVYLIARGSADDSSHYRPYVQIAPKAGSTTKADLNAAMTKQVSGTSTAIGTTYNPCPAAGCTVVGSVIHLRAIVQINPNNTSQTTIKVHAWTGSTEPTIWATATDTAAKLQGGGYNAIRLSSDSGLTNAGFNVTFDNYHVIDLSPPVPPTVSGGSLAWINAPSESVSASGSTGSYQYRVEQNGAWSPIASGSAATVTAEGESVVQFRAVGPAGNVSAWAPQFAVYGDSNGQPATYNIVRLDRTAPSAPTVFGGSSTPQNVPAVTVSACCSRDSGLVEPVHYQYRTSTDGGSTWSAPTNGSTVSISASGQTLAQFRALDSAVDATGTADPNASAWTPGTPNGTGTVQIDRTLPASGTHIAGGTHLSGSQLHWTLAGSPYYIGENGSPVVVDAGSTLTIDPGVKVIAGSSTAALDVYGTLAAVGTPTGQIIFTSLADATGAGGIPGQWSGIWFTNGSVSNMDFVTVEYAGQDGAAPGPPPGQGNFDTGSAALSVDSGSLSLDHVTIDDNKHAAVLVQHTGGGGFPSVLITHSELARNNSGVVATDATVTIDDNSALLNNANWGLSVTQTSAFTGTKSTIMHSDIERNATGVLISSSADPSLWLNGTYDNILQNGNGTQVNESIPPGISSINTVTDWTHNYWGPTAVAFPCLGGFGTHPIVDPSTQIPYHVMDGLEVLSDMVWGKLTDKAKEAVGGGEPLDLIENPFPSPTAFDSMTWTWYSNKPAPGNCQADNFQLLPDSPTYIDNSGL